MGTGTASGELTAATGVTAAVVIDFLADPDSPRESVEHALCECCRILREHHWSPERALAYCKRILEVQARAAGVERHTERYAWLKSQLVTWLINCYYRT